MSQITRQAIAQGTPVPKPVLGELRDSTDAVADGSTLRDRLETDGYVLLRGQLDARQVEAARNEIFERLHEVGEIESPASAGIFSGRSRRKELTDDLGHFWRSVSTGAALRQVSHGPRIHAIMETVYGEPARPHDYIFLRPSVPGRSTHLHYDRPFFARGSRRILTVWTALSDIPIELGPLMVAEGSQQFDDLLGTAEQIDYNSAASPTVQMLDDTVQFATDRGVRLLTTEFSAGDLIVFSMTIMHGTLDNHARDGRIRLSCDVRWQPAADPIDDRYVGDNPPGTTGAGYGELNGAKPLTEDWHKR